MQMLDFKMNEKHACSKPRCLGYNSSISLQKLLRKYFSGTTPFPVDAKERDTADKCTITLSNPDALLLADCEPSKKTTELPRH